MTDAEILERLRVYFQTQISNLNADEMAEGPFEDGTEDGELWEQAASRIDARGGLRVRFEFADDEQTLTAAAQQREERAADEARPHDDEPTRHPDWESCPVCNPKPDDTVPQSCTFVHHGHRCTFRPGHHMLWHKLTDGTEVNDQGEPMEADRG